ncbi:MAG: hypothetical protein HQL18_02900 [Candidatus Omnitrophica bacterium]|nr:hypothetical protein [Candidatus Omnitrophota bacterium]
MAKGRNKKFADKGIVEAVSFRTGLFLKKVAGLRKVAEKKPWKSVVAATKDICDTVGEKAEIVMDKVTRTVEKSTHEIGESFKAGMDSVAETHVQSKAAEAAAAPKKKPAAKTGVRSPVKKVKIREKIEKEASADADLDEEINKITKDVADM